MENIVHKYKILFLVAHLHKGGMQRAISNISIAIGNDFELYLGYFGTENPGFYFNAFEHDLSCNFVKRKGFFSPLMNFRARSKSLKDFVKKNRIDKVVSFGETASILNLATYHSAKKIVAVRVALKDSLGSGMYGKVYRCLIKMYYPRADLLLAVSHGISDELKVLIGRDVPIVIINNLYHNDEIVRRSKLELPSNFEFLAFEKFCVNVGNYSFQKGQDLLIEAFSKTNFCKNGGLLVLIGRGSEELRLKSLAIQLEISSQVIFTGFIENPYPFVRLANLFVLSSRFEGFPNSLVEAMIIGTPVVSFNCPTGPSEILVDDLSECLVDLEDVSALASKIDTVCVENDTIVKSLSSVSKMFDAKILRRKWISALS